MTKIEAPKKEETAEDNMLFTDREWLRYTRHIQLPQVGPKGQVKLKQSHVLVIGAGGLGSPVCLYLAAAGIGKITIVDADVVDITNLQRQIIFSYDQVGLPKAECAKQKMLALNPDIEVEAVPQLFAKDNADELVKGADLVIDCTDNFEARYLINDTCCKLEKAWSFGSIFQFSGQTALFTPESACFRCLFPEKPTDLPDCNTAGVLGVLPGLVGVLQANEAIKYLIDRACLANHLLLVDAMDLTFRKIKLSQNKGCPACNPKNGESIIENDYNPICSAGNSSEWDWHCDNFDILESNKNSYLLDVRTQAERRAFNLGGHHIVLTELENNLADIPQDKDIIIYCQSGIRGNKAAKILSNNDYQSVKNIKGGLHQILRAGSYFKL